MDALSVFRMDGSDPRLLGRINLDPVTFSYDPATSPTRRASGLLLAPSAKRGL